MRRPGPIPFSLFAGIFEDGFGKAARWRNIVRTCRTIAGAVAAAHLFSCRGAMDQLSSEPAVPAGCRAPRSLDTFAIVSIAIWRRPICPARPNRLACDRCNVRHADPSGAMLEGTIWHGCRAALANFTGADLRGGNIGGLRLVDANPFFVERS